MRAFSLESGLQSGIYNMALDEALLEFVRSEPEPTLIVRTYRWDEPTLSLGVNQQVRDIRFLLDFYGKENPVNAVVRRPTGGRAILHGEDISYSFITNDSTVLKQSLKGSYAIYAGIVQQALGSLALNAQFTDTASGRDYLRSPVCFETHTPSDLLGPDGKKLSGSAQLRRAGGLLQHGAAFLAPYGVSEAVFASALRTAAAESLHMLVEPYPAYKLDTLKPALSELEAAYCKESVGILASASITTGSHLEPASF